MLFRSRSVSQAVEHVAQGSGYHVVVTARPQDVMDAERVVLPGHMLDRLRHRAKIARTVVNDGNCFHERFFTGYLLLFL